MDAKDESSAHCCSGSHACCVPKLGGGGAGVLPITAVEVMRNGQPIRPIPGISTLSSEHAGKGANALSSTATTDILAVDVPVTVKAPPARKTISQARANRLSKKHSIELP